MKSAESATLAANAAAAADDSPASVRRGRVLMLLSVGFFVVNALVVRALGEVWGVDSWIVSAARFLVGFALVFAPGMPIGRPSLRRVMVRPMLIARGLLGGTGVYLYYYTVAELGAGRSTFINITYVVLGALLASVFLHERLRPAVVAAFVLGLAGMALLTGVALGEWTVSPADGLAMLGALVAGIVIVLIRKLHQRETTGSIFAAQCAWGFIIAAIPAADRWVMPTAAALLVLVLSGLLAGVGQLTMTAAYRRLPVAEGSLFQMLLPIGIGVGGIVFFAERYTIPEGIGAALIIVGCLLVMRTRPRLAAELPADSRQSPPAPGRE